VLIFLLILVLTFCVDFSFDFGVDFGVDVTSSPAKRGRVGRKKRALDKHGGGGYNITGRCGAEPRMRG